MMKKKKLNFLVNKVQMVVEMIVINRDIMMIESKERRGRLIDSLTNMFVPN